MGSCVSRSAATGSRSGGQGVATAKVVGMDGSVARYAAPVTAGEALGLGDDEGRGGPPCFVCSSDELRFDAPARALGAEEPLQTGQLYFVLPASMLRRALSGPDMAALAVRASAALAAGSGASSTGRNNGDDGGKQRKAARVAPLVAVSSSEPRGEEWYQHHAYGKYGTSKTVSGGDADETVGKARRGAGHRGGGDAAETVGKASRGAGHRGGGARHRAGKQRLGAIPEASSDST